MKRKNTLPPAVQKDLDQIVAPPVITLDAKDIEIIAEYRVAREAWEKAYQAAEASRPEGDLLWSAEGLSAVTAASEGLREHQASMAWLLNHLAKMAGI